MIALHGGYKANIKAAHIAALHFKGYGEGSGGGPWEQCWPSTAPQWVPRLLAGAGNREQSKLKRPRVRDIYFKGEKLFLRSFLFELRVDSEWTSAVF